MGQDSDSDSLRLLLEEEMKGATVANLRRLSGGASKETVAFDACQNGKRERLILRRASHAGSGASLSLDEEAVLLEALSDTAIPVPTLRHRLQSSEQGSGFIMARIEGETIARKILRDPRYRRARREMTGQCAEILAKIHQLTPENMPPLPVSGAREEARKYREIHDAIGHPRPVMALAFRWLEENMPEETPPRLVHGDFRNGNFIVGEEGIRAVLDWELAHFGDPLEDLGWLCGASWRFGVMEKIVGGFGDLPSLIASYERARGEMVDRKRLDFWRLLGTLKWGVICAMMAAFNESGALEQAAIGRRVSETEINLLNLLAPRGGGGDV